MKRIEYLEFTKRERTGIISLLAILIVTAIAPEFFCGNDNPPVDLSLEISDPDNFNKEKRDLKFYDTAGRQNNHEYAAHDYYKADYKNNAPNGAGYKKSNYPAKKENRITIVEINSADTSAFIALPGIGSRLASRIVSFREKLGGFYDVRQIGEVYGLQDSVFRKLMPLLKCDTGNLRKININNAGKEILQRHPYIRWSIANAIVSYRNEHGVFVSAGDLAKLENIDDTALKKILPYLSFK